LAVYWLIWALSFELWSVLLIELAASSSSQSHRLSR